MNKMNNDVLMRQLESTFSYFAKRILHRGYGTTRPADIAALTAEDVLTEYCMSMGEHCQECVFNDEANMCDLFFRIKQKKYNKFRSYSR